ncbi:MAG TPA: Fe-S oxidoreductase, partial [Lachnospiraceae bacterium]|nr:Fe-S oxidoreductase [Lachnospiraceae bacterium]
MKTRFRFTKTGSIKFIGHLDCMRFFQKALRRAKMDVAYTQGFNPHQIMSFASPLSVGLTSDGEYIDIEFVSLPSDDPDEVVQYLNACMTDELFVTEMKVLPDKT